MSKVKTRHFTVPKGSRFICLPLDGDGPCIAHEGAHVVIAVADHWEPAFKAAMEQLMRPEGEEPK